MKTENDHSDMNRDTARHIAQNQSLHKEAQDVLEESIFSAVFTLCLDKRLLLSTSG